MVQKSLGEADIDLPSGDSLEELFSRDPRELSDADIDQIVAKLQEQRRVWAAEEKSGARRKKASTTPSSTTTTKKKKDPPTKISLSDLGLGEKP